MLKIKLDEGAKMPTRSHEWDGGMDLYSRYTMKIPARGRAVFNTGVHMAIPKGFVGFIKTKSGMNIKDDLHCEGVVDSGYTGSIIVKLDNTQDRDYMVHKGEKIAQIVICPVWLPHEVLLVDELERTERGDNGFGSTGR